MTGAAYEVRNRKGRIKRTVIVLKSFIAIRGDQLWKKSYSKPLPIYLTLNSETRRCCYSSNYYLILNLDVLGLPWSLARSRTVMETTVNSVLQKANYFVDRHRPFLGVYRDDWSLYRLESSRSLVHICLHHIRKSLSAQCDSNLWDTGHGMPLCSGFGSRGASAQYFNSAQGSENPGILLPVVVRASVLVESTVDSDS